MKEQYPTWYKEILTLACHLIAIVAAINDLVVLSFILFWFGGMAIMKLAWESEQAKGNK